MMSSPETSSPRQPRRRPVLHRIATGALLVGFGVLFMVATERAHAADIVLRFDGGIGEQDAARAGANLIVNDVQGFLPGGRPWVISDLKAQVFADSSISVAGKGLLLAGGAAIGSNGGQSVRATLLCNGTSTVVGSVHKSALVPLEPDGDFQIHSALSPALPSTCGNPVLLITNPGDAWFAAGIPKR
jgi:hypothetical protein